MIPWPSILPARSGGAAPETVALLSATALDADGIELESPTPASGGESAARATAALAAPAGARWNAAALVASLIVHAAAIAGFGVLVAQDGLEAETDAIHIELVIEPASGPAAEASIAGDASETREAAAPADGAEPTALPRFEPLPPLAQIEAPGEQENASAPDETASDPGIDVAAALPGFSPLAPLTGILPEDAADAAGEPAAVEKPDVEEPVEARTERAPEPVLAVAPSLESMLPRIEVPPPPLFPPLNEAKPAAAVPAKKPDAWTAARSTAEPPTAAAKPARTPERAKAHKTETKHAATARAEKSGKSTAEAGATPPGGAKAKGKSQKATQAGSVASAAASSGDREAYGRKVNSHVQRYKRYPDAAARGGMKGAVKVSISIGGSGNLASARVTASSGYPVLDGEALATVRRAAPYPKPPAAFGGTARFSLTLRYSK